MLLDDGFHVSVRRLTNYPNVLSVDYIRGPVESYTRFYLLALLHRCAEAHLALHLCSPVASDAITQWYAGNVRAEAMDHGGRLYPFGETDGLPCTFAPHDASHDWQRIRRGGSVHADDRLGISVRTVAGTILSVSDIYGEGRVEYLIKLLIKCKVSPSARLQLPSA